MHMWHARSEQSTRNKNRIEYTTFPHSCPLRWDSEDSELVPVCSQTLRPVFTLSPTLMSLCIDSESVPGSEAHGTFSFHSCHLNEFHLDVGLPAVNQKWSPHPAVVPLFTVWGAAPGSVRTCHQCVSDSLSLMRPEKDRIIGIIRVRSITGGALYRFFKKVYISDITLVPVWHLIFNFSLFCYKKLATLR